MGKKLSLEIFIERSMKIHGHRYDYSKAEYNGANAQIAIICKKHGLFYTQACTHMNGSNCNKCAYEESCIQDFVKKAKKIHGNKYDYKLCDYKKSSLKIKIICKIHGVFEQYAHAHLSGMDCRKCAYENLKYTTEEFISQAKKVHKDRYDYSKVDYKYSLKHVKIQCKIHGIFEQYASSHLSGAGCPDCNQISKFGMGDYCKNKKITKFYVLYIPTEKFFKLGITQKTIAERYYTKPIPYRYKIYFSFESDCECIWRLECMLKKKFKRYKYRPKKYFGGISECFSYKIKPLLDNMLCTKNLKSKQSRKEMLKQLFS